MGRKTHKDGHRSGIQRHKDRKAVWERDRKEEEKWKQVWQQTRGPLKKRKCHPPWSHSPVTVSDALCVLSATRSS